MRKTKLNPLLPAAVALLSGMSSCIDNDYDLSDIDTTVRVEVNDLVVPVTIDKITLADILNIKEGDRIQVIDGVYAVTENGEFSSSDIKINSFRFPAPSVNSTNIVITPNTANSAKGLRAPGNLEFNLATTPENVTYHASNVPDNIISFGKVGCNLNFSLRISLPELGRVLGRVSLQGVKLQLPRGLEFSSVPNDSYTYNINTGEFTFNQPLYTDASGSLNLSFGISSIDATLAIAYHYDPHTIDFNSKIGVTAGTVSINASSLSAADLSSLSSVSMKIDYNFSEFEVTSMSGVIRYDVNGFNISDIKLSNLPGLLTQDDTNIGIANPQIFLSLDYPLNDYGVYASTGITITPVRNNQPGVAYGLDNGSFDLGLPHNMEGVYYYLLSPSASGAMSFPEFPDPVHVGYSNLAYILEGKGIPDALRVEFVQPRIPQQRVNSLPLGRSLGSLKGKYKFVAPLQFTDGSTIIYTSTETGWSSDDLNALTIEALTVDVDVSSDLPIALNLSGYPINTAGQKINNVDIVGANIEAGAKNQHVQITITGEITKLDGIVFEAHAYAKPSDALSPDMTIQLENIRPRVSGYYQKEL